MLETGNLYLPYSTLKALSWTDIAHCENAELLQNQAFYNFYLFTKTAEEH